MTIQEMRETAEKKGYTLEQLSQLVGISEERIQKIFEEDVKSKDYGGMIVLGKFFHMTNYPGGVQEPSNYQAIVKEKKAGEYTIKDLEAFPNNVRVELIDGTIYDMSAPQTVHQFAVGEIHRQIQNFILNNKGDCSAFVAPIDVKLDCDNDTMVQPDVLILCDKSKLHKWGIMGAPDFVLEVTSPSTRRKDCIKKLVKYEAAGVKEYWILDPDRKSMIVYDFQEGAEDIPRIHGLEEEVPVNLYQGGLQINLANIAEFIKDLEP